MVLADFGVIPPESIDIISAGCFCSRASRSFSSCVNMLIFGFVGCGFGVGGIGGGIGCGVGVGFGGVGGGNCGFGGVGGGNFGFGGVSIRDVCCITGSCCFMDLSGLGIYEGVSADSRADGEIWFATRVLVADGNDCWFCRVIELFDSGLYGRDGFDVCFPMYCLTDRVKRLLVWRTLGGVAPHVDVCGNVVIVWVPVGETGGGDFGRLLTCLRVFPLGFVGFPCLVRN